MKSWSRKRLSMTTTKNKYNATPTKLKCETETKQTRKHKRRLEKTGRWATETSAERSKCKNVSKASKAGERECQERCQMQTKSKTENKMRQHKDCDQHNMFCTLTKVPGLLRHYSRCFAYAAWKCSGGPGMPIASPRWVKFEEAETHAPYIYVDTASWWIALLCNQKMAQAHERWLWHDTSWWPLDLSTSFHPPSILVPAPA